MHGGHFTLAQRPVMLDFYVSIYNFTKETIGNSFCERFDKTMPPSVARGAWGNFIHDKQQTSTLVDVSQSHKIYYSSNWRMSGKLNGRYV
jgi:hypothetical protein